jgi:hypothetical protein
MGRSLKKSIPWNLLNSKAFQGEPGNKINGGKYDPKIDE